MVLVAATTEAAILAEVISEGGTAAEGMADVIDVTLAERNFFSVRVAHRR